MIRPLLTLALPLGLPVALWAALLAPGSATAEISQPDCATLAAWTGNTDFREVQALNPSTLLGFPTAFLGEEMAALYGKTGPEFTQDDVAQARQHAKDCRSQVGKAEAKQLAVLDRVLSKSLGGTLEAMEKAGGQLEAALEALSAAPDGADKLRVLAALGALETWDRNGYLAALRHASRDFSKLADGIARPLASLPQAAVAERVLPALAAQYDASLAAAVDETGRQIDAIEANLRNLQRYEREADEIVEPLEAALPPEAKATLAERVAARKVAIEQELVAAEMAGLAAAPVAGSSIGRIENAAGSGLMRMLSPEAAATFTAELAARRQEIALALIGELPADVQGLAALPKLAPALAESPAGLVGEAERSALQAAVSEKQAAAGAAVKEEMLARIAATPVETGAFAALARNADEGLLRLLAPEDAGAVRAAAEEKRGEIAEELYDLIEDELDEMDDTEKSLQIIDTALLPSISGWPASAASEKTRFLDAVVTKRNAILAAITEEQRGPLDGRTYMDRSGTAKLEFSDDGRAYFTDASGQTIVASYEEEGETRVLVTLPQATVVFTREGRWLVGGPLQLQRIDDQS